MFVLRSFLTTQVILSPRRCDAAFVIIADVIIDSEVVRRDLRNRRGLVKWFAIIIVGIFGTTFV